jgi:hypothetical protein
MSGLHVLTGCWCEVIKGVDRAVLVDLLRWSRGVFNGEALQLLCCSSSISPMKELKPPSKLTRAQLRESLDTVPVSHLLGKSAARELTPKQRAFAVEVAKGSSGAAAYRKAYNTKASPKIQGDAAYKLKAKPDIAQEIEAYKAAIDAETYRTPAGLRSLIIQSLVQTIIDPDTPPAVRVQAAKVAGQITEVGLYTERKEVRTITSSEDARAAIMAQLKQLSNASATDATLIDADADSLLAELKPAGDATHPSPTPQADDAESLAYIHTIPHEQSPLPTNLDGETPPPLSEETPPSSFKTRPTGG